MGRTEKHTVGQEGRGCSHGSGVCPHSLGCLIAGLTHLLPWSANFYPALTATVCLKSMVTWLITAFLFSFFKNSSTYFHYLMDTISALQPVLASVHNACSSMLCHVPSCFQDGSCSPSVLCCLLLFYHLPGASLWWNTVFCINQHLLILQGLIQTSPPQ